MAASDDPPFRPAARMDVGDLEVLRVLADPLRLRIIDVLARTPDEPQSVKAIAAALDEGPTKLYYHMALLEEHGLIRMTATRVVSGIIEKRYQPTARTYLVDRSVLDRGSTSDAAETVGTVVGSLLQGAHDDIVASLRDGRMQAGEDVPVGRRALITRTFGRMSPDHARSFFERMQALLDELDAADDAQDATAYGMTLALFPTRPDQPGGPDA